MELNVKDGRWDIFYPEIKTIEQFAKLCPVIEFRSNIHDDVKKNFQLIQKLITYSFYEYQFYDNAMEKALLTLEMALKIRYEEIMNRKWRNNLKTLLYWFLERDYFECQTEASLDLIRSVRNDVAHPTHHSVGGPFLSQWVTGAANLINEIYNPNIDLRIERKRIIGELNKSSRSHVKFGGIVNHNKLGRKIFYDLRFTFLDNSSEKYDLYGFYRIKFNEEEKIKDSVYQVYETYFPFQIRINQENLNLNTVLKVLNMQSFSEKNKSLADWLGGFKTEHQPVMIHHAQESEAWSMIQPVIEKVNLK